MRLGTAEIVAAARVARERATLDNLAAELAHRKRRAARDAERIVAECLAALAEQRSAAVV